MSPSENLELFSWRCDSLLGPGHPLTLGEEAEEWLCLPTASSHPAFPRQYNLRAPEEEQGHP